MSKYLQLILVILSAMGLTVLFLMVLSAQGKLMASPQTSIIVNTLEDEDTYDGDYSLREAIHAANNNITVDACPAGEVITDTITLSVNGTIMLNSQIMVSTGGSLLIDGTSMVTISGGNSVRIFFVTEGADLKLESLTIVDGIAYEGGGIKNQGTLAIRNSALTDNSTVGEFGAGGGGICNDRDSVLTIINSTLSDNSSDTFGGAIHNASSISLIITDSILSGNSANVGGGISNGGMMTLMDSTIFENSATDNDGGIYNNGYLTLIDSSVFGNNALNDGGGIGNRGSLTVINSTISGNSADFGAGIRNSN